MARIMVNNLPKRVGEEVEIAGWVAGRRDHGKLIFLDLRDASGVVQAVALPNHTEAHQTASTVRSEWIVVVKGKVNPRPEKMINTEIPTGKIELEILELTVLNPAETPAFDLAGDGRDINEESRLQYRYLDLRRPRLQKNIRARHQVIKFIRAFLDARDFVEVETPILTKSTPEGARDYIVPSRLYPGTFYALPQSPQQYKQLLMAAGLERYYQIARCFRDEDTRGDRQPEFTQLDLEMSFVTEEDIISLTETMLIELVKTLYPQKRIQQTPFPRLTYKEAMAKYSSDRPDLREDKNDPDLLAFCWVVDFPFFEKADNNWTFTHNPFSAPKPEHRQWLMAKENIGEIIAAQYDIVLNGLEVGGGSLRNHEPAALEKVFEIMGFDRERIEQNFGHMLKALGSGTPPHGGIAPGLDRLIMILQNEPNIREVIAFPKTGEGRDPLMAAPSPVTSNQLQELNIKIIS